MLENRRGKGSSILDGLLAAELVVDAAKGNLGLAVLESLEIVVVGCNILVC